MFYQTGEGGTHWALIWYLRSWTGFLSLLDYALLGCRTRALIPIKFWRNSNLFMLRFSVLFANWRIKPTQPSIKTFGLSLTRNYHNHKSTKLQFSFGLYFIPKTSDMSLFCADPSLSHRYEDKHPKVGQYFQDSSDWEIDCQYFDFHNLSGHTVSNDHRRENWLAKYWKVDFLIHNCCKTSFTSQNDAFVIFIYVN